MEIEMAGCASRNLHKMDQKGTENDQAGSSKAGPGNDSPKSPHIESIDKEVKKFLEQENDFQQGLVLADNEINKAIEFLNRDKNILNKTSFYKEFLNKYGSIHGSDLSMCGPLVECYKGYKVQNMVSRNNTFGDFCKNYGITEEKLRFYWLVGQYKKKFYYIDSSDDGKGQIYSLDLYSGKIKHFSKDFLIFLRKIFNFYEEDSSDEDFI